MDFCSEKKLLNLKIKEYKEDVDWASDGGRGKRSCFFGKLSKLNEDEKEKDLIIFCEEILNRFGDQIDADGPPNQIEHISRLKQFLNQKRQEIDLKFLIFAAKDPKPAIVFKNFLSLEGLEIVERGGDHLLFKEKIGENGLMCRDLQEWWVTTQSAYTQRPIPDEIWRKQWEALKERLISSVGSNCEKILMETYFSVLHDYNYELPALIPQAYYQWLTTSLKELNSEYSLVAQKMDFLIIIKNRLVNIEVDGPHHYADGDYYTHGKD